MFPFPDLEPVCCSMSSSNRCFLTCTQISLESGKVVWYCHLFKNIPQIVVTNTVKGFGVVIKAEVDVFLQLSCFFDNPADVGNLISGSSAFSKTSLNISIQKTKIMASSPITLCIIDGETMETNSDRLYFSGLQNHCRW